MYLRSMNKSIRTIVLGAAMTFLYSCGNNETTVVKAGQKTLVDSLEMDVDKGHNLGMAKMGKLTRYQQYVKSLRDSISRLPAASRNAMNKYSLQLDTLQRQLDTADLVMNRWMEGYRPDSLKNDPETRAFYLSGEKIKIDTMVGLILQAIKMGDSLLPIAKPGK
jgi:hypothetical protein